MKSLLKVTNKIGEITGEITGVKMVKLFHPSLFNRRCGEFLQFPTLPQTYLIPLSSQCMYCLPPPPRSLPISNLENCPRHPSRTDKDRWRWMLSAAACCEIGNPWRRNRLHAVFPLALLTLLYAIFPMMSSLIFYTDMKENMWSRLRDSWPGDSRNLAHIFSCISV